MVTIGKTETGKPIVRMLKPVAYFRTYNEAYTALLEYNKDPYDLNLKTVGQLYEEWLPKYQQTVNDHTYKLVTVYWKHCEPIKDMYLKDVRSRHCKMCVDSVDTYSKQQQVHHLLNMLLDYALEYDLVDSNYSRSVSITAINNPKDHISFTKEELNTLWKHKDDPIVRMILVECYSGWRPSELLGLHRENISTENWTMTGGMKTKAGKDRLVPVHEKIKDLVTSALTSEGAYLFNPHWSYTQYRNRFNKAIANLKLNPEHKPHDCRKTFVTLCKNAGVDEYAIKYLVGHAIKDITEKTYTERDIEWLSSELSKV